MKRLLMSDTILVTGFYVRASCFRHFRYRHQLLIILCVLGGNRQSRIEIIWFIVFVTATALSSRFTNNEWAYGVQCTALEFLLCSENYVLTSS